MKRPHLTYANVTATVALILAMSSSAFAASRYIITSTSQIKPSVLRQLQGRAGPAGEQGRPGQNAETQVWFVYRPQVGPPGEQGKTGPTGPTGPRGTTGP